ncbi:nuclear transport factor 2 family protein [Maritimibacter sp. UBA3975]|uniref:nuclear transport factor 2 family protein n=1 Tax=Maritimibacter sp. UBA3975 TaxID=1946833 RepID=UPI000C0B1C9E|nr:nuclear transport factor 2 family protein [Maritimibacter sp. UBA3975]MAM59880.1 hypothetical protein [Maritimibacter sp.]|tara:strand:- start:16974 stop:17399 length:426 start_codon:yes stop_codon:yes gene_type:complete
MEPQQAKALIDTAWRAISQCDWDTLETLSHPDAAMRYGASQRVAGPGGVRAFFEHYGQNYRLDMRDYHPLVSGDRAAVETRLRLTYHTTKAGFPEARGQFAVVPFASFITFRDNLFYRTHLVYSLDDWMRVFDAAPEAQGR